MGHHANAYLFYGIGFEEGTTLGEESAYKWEDVYVRKAHGLTQGVLSLSDYWKQRDPLVKSSTCEVDTHCHCDYGIPFVYLRGTFTRSAQGDTTEVKLDLPCPKEEADARIKAFCELMGLPYTQPKWLIASYEG